MLRQYLFILCLAFSFETFSDINENEFAEKIVYPPDSFEISSELTSDEFIEELVYLDPSANYLGKHLCHHRTS